METTMMTGKELRALFDGDKVILMHDQTFGKAGDVFTIQYVSFKNNAPISFYLTKDGKTIKTIVGVEVMFDDFNVYKEENENKIKPFVEGVQLEGHEEDPHINTGSIWMSVNNDNTGDNNWEYQVDDVHKDENDKWTIRMSDRKTYNVHDFHRHFRKYPFEVQPGLTYTNKQTGNTFTVKEISSDLIKNTEDVIVHMDDFFKYYNRNEDAILNSWLLGDYIWYFDKENGKTVETNVLGVKFIDGDWYYKVSGSSVILDKGDIYGDVEDLMKTLYKDDTVYE